MRTLGIDLGTSGLKAVVMDSSLKICGECSEEYDVCVPEKGYAVQNPELWYHALKSCLGQLDCRDVAAVAFSGQMHGLVMLDGQGLPVDEAVIWCDQRSAAEAGEINAMTAGLGRRLRNQCASGFMLSSLLWMKRKRPEVYRRIRCVMMPKDYLIWKLTGVRCTDPGDGVGSGALNLETMAWDRQLLEGLGIDAGLFVPVLPSGAFAGEVQAGEGTLRPGIPVFCGSGDHGMQLLGNGIFSPGTLSVNIGTSCQISGVVKLPREFNSRDLYLFAHPISGNFSMTGTGYNGGAALKWLRNTWYPGQSYGELTDMAGQSEPGSRGVIFLPFINGERGREELRGNFCGISLATSAADIIRACLEGVLYRIREYREMLQARGVDGRLAVLSGGAASSPFWMQLAADIMQLPVYTGPFRQQAAAGAALLAGMSSGAFPAPDILEKELAGRLECAAQPDPGSREIYDRRYEEYRELCGKLYAEE